MRDGAHVYGPRPLHTLSLDDSRQAAAFRALAERVWGEVDGVSVFSRPYGKGSVSWGRPIAQLLAERRLPPQLAAGRGNERDFLFAHRRVGDADVFFVANQWDRALSRELSFRVGRKTPEIWDPETGDVTRPAAFRSEGDQLTLPVHFAPFQALLFVFRPGLPARFVTSVARGGTTLFPATGAPAEVPRLAFESDGLAVVPETSGPLALETSDGRTLSGRFVAPEALPVAGLRGTLELRGPAAPEKPIEISGLRSLTEYEQPEIRYFSGEATYRLHFSVADWQAAAGDLLRLDLGDFESVAEVTLNGVSLGTLWRPGSALDVTRSLRRDNELVVTVANVYRNRAIGDLTQYGELRNLHTSSPISDFLSPKKPLKRSGLMGPIQVTRIPRQRVPGL